MRFSVEHRRGQTLLTCVLAVLLAFPYPVVALAEGELDEQTSEQQTASDDSSQEEVSETQATEDEKSEEDDKAEKKDEKDELDELQEKLGKRKEELNQQISIAQETLASLNTEAELAEYDLLTVTAELNATNALIDDLDVKIPETKAQLDETRKELGDLIAKDYKEGTPSLLDVLLEVTSFEDFLTRVEYANRIYEYKSDVVTQAQDLNSQLVQQRYDLELEKVRQEQLVAEQQKRVANVEAAAASTQAYYNELSEELQSMLKAEEEAKQVANEESARAAAAEALKIALEQTGGDLNQIEEDNGEIVTLAPASNAATFVSRAFSIIGAGYQWSGYTWLGTRRGSAFTCSGVVDFARGRPSRSSSPEILYAEVGSRLVTDVSQLQYGDLVFYSYAGRQPGHVGIYVGGGSIIDSTPNVGVAIHDVNFMDFIGGGPIY